MIPGQPHQALATRAQPRAGIEVVAFGDDMASSIGGDDFDRRLRLAALDRGFCHHHHLLAAGIVLQVGKADVVVARRDGADGGVGITPIDRLIGRVDEPHGLPMHGKRCAAVFVDRAARTQRCIEQ